MANQFQKNNQDYLRQSLKPHSFVCVSGVLLCHHAHMLGDSVRSEDILQDLVLPFYHMGPRDLIKLDDLVAGQTSQSLQ